MEATKAANLVEHEADIYSRPARTWFQTPRQKAALAEAARADAGGLGLRSGSEHPAAGDKRKRDKEAARQERKRKRGQEEAVADKRRKNNRLIEVRPLMRGTPLRICSEEAGLERGGRTLARGASQPGVQQEQISLRRCFNAVMLPAGDGGGGGQRARSLCQTLNPAQAIQPVMLPAGDGGGGG